MNSDYITQIAQINLKTFEVATIIRGLERVETEEGRALNREFEELYKSMTGKQFGNK